MDDIVKQAMAKWPNVPDCYSWLGLDARGNWYMRDDNAQAAGAFGSGKPGAKGSILRHEKLIDFIQRNYAADAKGRWFFQNGPQRVYVDLEATPWIWRLQDGGIRVHSHSGVQTEFKGCLMDESGWVYLDTALGFGLVHSQDVAEAALAIEAGRWPLEEVHRADLALRFGYIQTPTAGQQT